MAAVAAAEDSAEEEEEVENNDTQAVRALVRELASSSLDTKDRSYRSALLARAYEALDSLSARRILALEWNGDVGVCTASSRHAHRRMASLFTTCLLIKMDKGDDDDDAIKAALCRGLAWYCRAAGDPALLDAQLGRLLLQQQPKDESSAAAHSEYCRELSSMFSLQAAAANNTSVVAAVALGSALETHSSGGGDNDGDNNSTDWCQVLVQHSTTEFSSAADLGLARSFLGTISADQWRKTVSPALILKLKSHPDKALSTILGWIQQLPAADVDDDDEWMPLLLKHLTSAKDENRALASDICLAWAQNSGVQTCNTFALALASCKTATLTPARVSVYATLEQLASCVNNDKGLANTDMIGTVLGALVAMIQKEPRAEHRICGQRALVEWMVVAKRAKEEKGYSQVMLELIQKPVQSKKATDATAILQLMVQQVHPDLLESMAADIWMTEDSKLWTKGIEGLLNSAGTKKAVQVDALLALYFCLLSTSESKKTKLPAFVAKHVSAGATKKGESFMYASSMMDAVSSNGIVSTLLHRTMALYTELASKSNSSETPPLFARNKTTAASRALALCAIYPSSSSSNNNRGSKEQYASKAIVGSLERILTYQPFAAESLVQALQEQVDVTAKQLENTVAASNATRQARENDVATTRSGSGSFHVNSVRQVANLLSKNCKAAGTVAKVLVLMHAGSTFKKDGRQRAALILNSTHVMRNTVTANTDIQELGEEILKISAGDVGDAKVSAEPQTSSNLLHQSALSLLLSLGGLASNFPPGTDEDEELQPFAFSSKLCKQSIAPLLSAKLKITLARVEDVSARDVEMYRSPAGTLFRLEDTSSTDVGKANKRLSEEEEWELQMKKELAEKKQGVANMPSGTLSPEEKKLVAQQDVRRSEITAMLTVDFVRVLDSIRYLCSSDIEVGNECLPVVAEYVLAAAVSVSPAISRIRSLQDKTFGTLTALGACVYEIDEVHAPTMTTALLISCRKAVKQNVFEPNPTKDKSTGASVSPLPSPCASAACLVHEMDQFGDALCGASFSFLFPIIQASLMGPRTPPGCEAALSVLERHTELLSQDVVLGSLRKDMVISVLELLKHDRALTFQEPTPFETLAACYHTGNAEETASAQALTAAELAPLADERGALGSRNCRIGSMMALARIAQDHRKLIKSNPLIENRIWLNCFESDDDIQANARKTWATVNGVEETAMKDSTNLPRPSPLYASPLVPLLSHSDSSISKSAAGAYAHAMGMHPGSVARNIRVLCTAYIDAFPTGEDAGAANSTLPLPASKAKAPPKLTLAPQKKLSTGLPKKKAPGKSALAVAGIGKPKTAKKKLANSALLKPKQERTLDQESLVSQFKTAGVQKVEEEKDSPAKIAVRLGVLRAIAAFSVSSVKVEMDETVLELLTSFLMAYGIADSEESVKGAARNALRDVVASNGGSDEAIAFLLPHLEAVLKNGIADEGTLGELPKQKVPKDLEASDRRKEGAVVALGSVALHLKGPENEVKVENTVDMLISALKTPSEEVQLSVADALTKLMKKGRTQDRIESILSDLLKNCLSGETMATRRGSSYGLSAAVKGSGITTLKKYEVVKQLEEACASGGPNSKEGSLFAIELLSSRLGLLFEPYVIVLLPSLLKAFSDSSDYVRKAANNTAGLIMSKLSAHGVKLVMPAVLTAFNDPAWRTKQASIHMLGAMSHLAPKQLASALPKVVPQLTEAFSDTHTKVKVSAQEALLEISTVVKNPEISSISPVLLKALTDPADHTIKALESLIETEFLHAIDAPSLSLIVPILHRGLRDRGATTKRLSGLIAGNICTMINDPKDFVPYLPTLLPDLKLSLLDPIPDVRSTSAKALGSLTRSLGDHILLELRPWLIQQLRDGTCSSAERSGAAQGLTEVLIASGSTMVEETMRSEILPLRSYPEASTREGVLWMLTFLPPALGQGFTPLIDVSLPALIKGLSDDSEPVRDVALRAGRVLIRSHGKVHVDKILPSLEASLSDDDHRIRVASLSLLGDLLSMIGGTQILKGQGDTQDDIKKAERAQAQIALVLGSETRKRVLSGLYLARSDAVHMVRQSAVQVWKTVVSVTVRALRDILPVLVAKIIDDLASGNEDMTEAAGRCLGDLVGKLGDSVLPQIIPVLRNALYDGDEHTKRGVCVGLTEVIKCSTKEQIIRFIEIIVKVIQDALSDDDEAVRKMAASSFQSLHAVVGSRAMDEVVPSLMVALETGEADETSRMRAVNGLTGILSVRSRELLPYIIPRLIERPMSTNHAQVLAGVAHVTGSTIHFHFASIIPALLGELADIEDGDDEKEEAIRNCSQAVCGSVDHTGVNWLIGEIASKCGSDKASLRRESCRMFGYVVTERSEKADFYEQVPIILRELLYRLNDDNETVIKANHAAFAALSKNVPAEELVKHIEFMRNLLASMVSDARRRKGGVGDGEFLLPGFNMPKGLEPLIPIYQRGILYGSPVIREVAASGLGEVIGYTSSKYLAGPLIVKMTGPLLRIVGDRNPSNVKVAILKTLGLVLTKGGPALRAFVPQFQTTFVKALSDPSRQVRVEAINALSLLMPLSTRVDPLIKELVSGSLGKNASAEALAVAAIQTATLEALATVLEKGGTKAKLPVSIPSALDASKELLSSSDDGIRESAARVMGISCSLLGADITQDILTNEILNASLTEANDRHGKACAIRRILASEVGSSVESRVVVDLKKMATGFLNDDKSAVREAGCAALGAAIGRSSNPKSSLRSSEADLLRIMNSSKETLEMHRAVARGFCVALLMIDADERIDFMGLKVMDTLLEMALKSSQRVQFAINDVLWLALDVTSGQGGLERYCEMAVFENQRSMKSLHSKVLTRAKDISILES